MEFLPVWSTLHSSTLPADRLSMHALPPCIFFFSFNVLILFSFRNKINCSESPSYDYQARTPPITTKSDTLSRNILPSLSASSSIEYQPDLQPPQLFARRLPCQDFLDDGSDMSQLDTTGQKAAIKSTRADSTEARMQDLSFQQ